MPKQINFDELSKANPKVNLDQLAEGRQLLSDIRGSGVRRARRESEVPFGRKRARIVDDLASDPRVKCITSHERAH
jgi:hypothetical protein